MKYSILFLFLSVSILATDKSDSSEAEADEKKIVAVLKDVGRVVELYFYLAKVKNTPLDKQYELQRMGTNLLMLASYFGHTKVVKILLSQGAPVDSATYFGSTPLFYAIEQGHVPVVKILLDYGANLFTQNRYKETPVQLIARSQNTTLTEFLSMYADQPKNK